MKEIENLEVWFPKPGGWPGGFDLAGKRTRIKGT